LLFLFHYDLIPLPSASIQLSAGFSHEEKGESVNVLIPLSLRERGWPQARGEVKMDSAGLLRMPLLKFRNDE
jgi:hypothetical protein